jgi:hypothetical protein
VKIEMSSKMKEKNNMQRIPLQDIKNKILEYLSNNKFGSFKKFKTEIKLEDGSNLDDYQVYRALNELKNEKKIVEVPRKRWKDYGIKKGDCKIAYILVKNNFSMIEWDEMMKSIFEKGKLTQNKDKIDRVLEEIWGKRRERYLKYRNYEDFINLIDLYNNIENFYQDKDRIIAWQYNILDFILNAIETGFYLLSENEKINPDYKILKIFDDKKDKIINTNESFFTKINISNDSYIIDLPPECRIPIIAFKIHVLLNPVGSLKIIKEFYMDYTNALKNQLENKALDNNLLSIRVNNIRIIGDLISVYKNTVKEYFLMDEIESFSRTLLKDILNAPSMDYAANLRYIRDILLD